MRRKHIHEFHGLHQLTGHHRMFPKRPGWLLHWLKVAIGFLVFCCLSDGSTYLLKKFGVLLPGSVAGLIILVTFLFFIATEQMVDFFKPAAALLLKWLSLFYVPALVVLPLSLSSISASDYPKLVAIQIGGVVFIAVLSGWTLTSLMRLRRWHSDNEAISLEENHHQSVHRNALSDLLLPLRVLLGMGVMSLLLITLYAALPASRPAVFFILNIIALPLFFILGQYAHIVHPKYPIPHPLLTSTVLLIALIWILGIIDGSGLLALLPSYQKSTTINLFVAAPSTVGPGNIYLYVLNAAIVSMALPIYGQKHALILHGIEVLITALSTSFISIIATVGVARLLEVSPLVIRSIALRTVTTPISIAAAPFLGGVSGIAGIASVTSGIIGSLCWRPLFVLNRYTKPITRGLVMGTLAQGLGTAIFITEEPESAPFSSVAFVTIGIASSVWIAIPSVREVINTIVSS